MVIPNDSPSNYTNQTLIIYETIFSRLSPIASLLRGHERVGRPGGVVLGYPHPSSPPVQGVPPDVWNKSSPVGLRVFLLKLDLYQKLFARLYTG